MKDKIKTILKNKKMAVIIGCAAILVLVAIIIGIMVALIFGKDDSGKKGGPVDYTLNILTEGGMPFGDINVYVYNDEAKQDLAYAGRTDEEGRFKFTTDKDIKKLTYTLDGLPKEGYELKDTYEISKVQGENKDQIYIYISTKIETLTDLENTKFDEGSIIKDFTLTTPDQTKVTISQLLKEKDAVVLNFFYLGCQPCKGEFPFLEEAYKQYSDKVAVIAMTPLDSDDTKIKEYVEELGLTFHVAQCDSRWEKIMELKAYPTTVVIDKWGMISFIHEGAVTESGVFESIFAYYTSADYKQGIVKHLDDIINFEAEEGTEGNPIVILPDSEETEISIPAGKEKYFDIPKVSNLVMSIEDENAYVIYEDVKYEAKDGVVRLTVSAPDPYTPAKLIIGNKSAEDKKFVIKFEMVAGTMMKPFEAVIGGIETFVEGGNDQGVYYSFIATESGTLTYTPASVTNNAKYDVTLYNLNTYANRTLSADGEDNAVSVVVNKGDVVQIIIATLPDENNEYPEATVKGDLSFVAGEGTGETDGETEYTITVKDADGKAVSGVKVIIDTKELTTDASGKAKATLKSGAYAVSITAPDGYKVQGEVNVSVDNPSVDVVLVSVNAKQVTYTIKVTDESGKAINGATVIVGNSVVKTNASGTATVTVAEGKYDVTVSAEGYDTGSGSVTKTTTATTIKLKKSTGTAEGVTYTVNAVDYKGTGISGVTVIFKSGQTSKATAVTDANGKATTKLPKGNYDVSLAYDGYGFDSSNAKVTSTQTSVTVTMGKVVTKSEEVYFDGTGAYYIEVGGQYVEIPAADKNNDGGNAFFLFEPTKTGTYKVALSSKSATISYWGGSTFFVSDATGNIEHTATTLTFNVKEIGPTYIIGVKGVSNCVISVTRTGNAVYDESDMEWTDYTQNDTIKKFTLGSGKLTYVDITKSADTYKLVYNSTDGYYHLGSESGPVMLVHLGAGAPIISLSDVVGFTGSGGSNFGKYFYDANDKLIKKENYTNLLFKYMNNMDEDKFVYPLTKDLMYILKNGGEFRGWWSKSGDENVIYDAKPGLNSEIAWMWACCYVS